MRIHFNRSVQIIVVVLLCSIFSSFAQAAERPNIIFILGDDQAWWDYSFMYRPDVEGAALDPSIPNNYTPIYQVAQTPAIDRLADEGLTFTHGYTVPLCRPSLQAIITGLFPHQNLVSGNDMVGRADDTAADNQILMNQSLARTLVKRFGYRAFQTGKWWGGHYQNGGFTEGNTVNSTAAGTNPPQYTGSLPSYARARHGDWGLLFGRVDYVNDIPDPDLPAPGVANPISYANTIVPATDFIDSCVASDEPFFLWYAPFLPHDPFDPPAGLRNKYDALINEPNESGNHIAKYYANIERLDGGIGALLDHLDAAGIADNTMIIFICDNGWITLPNNGGIDRRAKQAPSDAGTRTPIIVHWPAMIRPGGAVDPQFVTTPVSVIDLVTTALAAVDLDPTPEQRGVNLMNLAEVNARDSIFCDVYAHDMVSLENPVESIIARFVVKDGWKLLKFPSSPVELYHLYDTSTDDPVDPFETSNLATTETAKVAELSALIDDWYDEPKDMAWSKESSQMLGTDGIAIPDALGQSFTVAGDSYLVGVNIPFMQVDAAQSISVELRELDGSGAPTGALIASSSLQPDPVYQSGFRWSLFLFPQPVAVTAGQQLGFLVKSQSQPNSGFQIAYNGSGGYSGGSMFYSGTIGELTWDAANLDLAFQVLGANYDLENKASILADGNTVYVAGEMAVRGQPVDFQVSTNLAAGNWISMPMEDNLDGLVVKSETLLEGRKFYRFGLSTIGNPFSVGIPTSIVLYDEAFDGTGVNLNGQAPNTTTDSATWSAPTSAAFLANGDVPGTSGSTAWLPFDPENGFVYTLEATLVQSATDEDQWISFGFTGSTPSVNSSHSNTGLIWALDRNVSSNDDQVMFVKLSGGAGPDFVASSGDYVTGAASVNMKIVIDTTSGSGNWTYDWIVDGDPKVVDAALAPAFESAIGSVSISKRNGATSNRFSLLRLIRE